LAVQEFVLDESAAQHIGSVRRSVGERSRRRFI
jgi:hypothetical protein